MTSVMALDGVTSFLRLKDVKNACKRLPNSPKFDGISSGYTPLNIHEIWLRLLLGEHLLYIRARMTSFVNSLD